MDNNELLLKIAPNSTASAVCEDVLTHIRPDDGPDMTRPFLSVITRTVGTRLDGLKEVFLCLAGQDCMDFEEIVLGHNLAPEAKAGVLKEIEDAPGALQGKICFHEVSGGTRTTPINVGFQLSRGLYTAILDDDDLVLANWVSAFLSLFESHNGKLFHSGILKQAYDRVERTDGSFFSTPAGPYEKEYVCNFDYTNMMRLNRCPPHSIAFPRWIFHNYGLRFDETLTTTEDWDFIMRAASICGVAETGQTAGIYRWWREGTSSRTEHGAEEWDKNKEIIEDKIRSKFFILPPKGVEDVIDLNRQLERTQHEFNVLKNLYDERVLCGKKLEEIRAMMDSFSWKITAPLRIREIIKGHWKPLRHIETFDYRQACVMHDKMLNSKSTKLADKVRRLLKKSSG